MAQHKSETILIFGRGYMAHRIETYLNQRGHIAQISPADVTKAAQLEEAFTTHKPTVVINAAGKTIIDEVEKLENRATAFLVNVGGPANIAYYAHKYHTYCVQLSSGCIFDGIGHDGKGFVENDLPNPGCYYGWTKAWGDWQLYPFLTAHDILILRLRMPLSAESHPRNLLNKLQKYDNVLDSQNSITVVEDFIPVLEQLMQKRATGIFHVTNPGTMSPYEIVDLLKKYGQVSNDKKIERITKQQLDEMTTDTGRARRVNTILNTDKLTNFGITMRDIRTAIEDSVKQFKSEA